MGSSAFRLIALSEIRSAQRRDLSGSVHVILNYSVRTEMRSHWIDNIIACRLSMKMQYLCGGGEITDCKPADLAIGCLRLYENEVCLNTSL